MRLSLANLVKTKRKEANLTQQEFADRAGVALTVVRKIEQGKENLSLVKSESSFNDVWTQIGTGEP